LKNFILKRINNKNDLNESLIFLANKFNWSFLRRQETYKMLISQNQKKIIFGYLLKNRSNQIVGGLLTLLQGQIILNSKKTNVVNIFSWFIEEKFRGLGGLEMCIMLDKDFKNHTITNYTPSNEVINILKAFGFKRIYYQLISVNILNTIFLNHKKFSRNQKRLLIKDTHKYFYPNNCYIDKIKLSNAFIVNDKKILVEGIKTHIIKSFFKIPIVLPVFQIFNISEHNISYEEWIILCRKIILKYLVFSVNTSLFNSDIFNLSNFKNKYKSSFLIQNSFEEISFIPIIGSELSLVTNAKDLLLPILDKFKKIIKNIFLYRRNKLL